MMSGAEPFRIFEPYIPSLQQKKHKQNVCSMLSIYIRMMNEHVFPDMVSRTSGTKLQIPKIAGKEVHRVQSTYIV